MADDSGQVDQDEIEQLLRQSQGAENTPAAKGKAAPPVPTAPNLDQVEIEALLGGAPPVTSFAAPAQQQRSPAASAVSQNDLDLLLSKAEEALASIDQDSQTILPAGVRTFEFEQFRGTAANTEVATLELMRDVQLDMTIELGRTYMQLEDVLLLRKGAVVPLDKLAGDPADIYVNGRLIARGEILVLNDTFCIRVAELIVGEAA
jgi:flagellar motor switch protein FliN/FliY